MKVGPGHVTLASNGTHVALAWCSPEDQFVKRLGSIKARGRLNSSRYARVWVQEIKDALRAASVVNEVLRMTRGRALDMKLDHFDFWRLPRWVGWHYTSQQR